MFNPYQVTSAKILNIRQETEDVNTFKVQLKKPLNFKAGQFVLVSYPGFGEGPFVPCSMPGEQTEIELCIRKVGTLTEKLHQLKVGDSLDLRGPYGHGWQDKTPFYRHSEASAASRRISRKNLLLVAGGMGLVPLRPVILQYLARSKNVGPSTGSGGKFLPNEIQVFYGAKTPDEMIFKDDYNEWQKAGIDLNLTVDKKLPNWTGHVGLITTLFDDVKLTKNAICFMVGPPIMYKFVLPKLTEAGFADKDIFVSLERRMHCGLGICQHCAIGSYYVCHNGPIFCWSDLKKLGDIYQMM